MARHIIFYSWQANRPNKTNRGLIQTALERAAESLGSDAELDVEPVVERDTTGITGSPDIAATIFNKIDHSDVFVADVSLVTTDSASRPSPNPNVLVELGYAMKALGWQHVVLVLNREFGGPELLPFDLRARRAIVFEAPDGDGEGEIAARKSAREFLQAQFDRALRDIIQRKQASSAGERIAPATEVDELLAAIGDQRVDRAAMVRKFVWAALERLQKLSPDLAVPEWRHEELVQSLEASLTVIRDFLRIARRGAEMGDGVVRRELHRLIEHVASLQFTPVGFSGTSWTQQFDYWNFLTHELFVGLVGCWLTEDRLAEAAQIAREPFIIPNKNGEQGVLGFEDLSRPLPTLNHRNQALNLNRVSLHGDLLKQRYEGPLSEVLKFDDFLAGDVFLFLISELPLQEDRPYPEWYAHSILYAADAPRFLVEAVQTRNAVALAETFGLSVSDFKERLARRLPIAAQIYGHARHYAHGPLARFKVGLIATK